MREVEIEGSFEMLCKLWEDLGGSHREIEVTSVRFDCCLAKFEAKLSEESK